MRKPSPSRSSQNAPKRKRVGWAYDVDLPAGAPTVGDINPRAFEHLVATIIKANGLAKDGTSYGERQAVTVKLLNGLDLFLLNIELPSSHLHQLCSAMQEVSEGYDHPLFKPQRTGRPKESFRLLQVKGISAAAMQILMENGYKKWDAARAVTSVLADNDFRLTGGGKIASYKTIAAWRDRVIGSSSDPVFDSFASAIGRIECRGRLLAHLRTSDPKVKIQRALKEVKWAAKI